MSWQQLLLDEPPLLLRRRLAVRLGVNEAIVLQQLHFVLTHIDGRAVELDGRRWCKAAMDYWSEQFPFFSEATIKRVFASLRESGVVLTQRGREANVYTINYDTLALLGDQSDPCDRSERSVQTGQIDPSPCIGEKTEDKQQAAGAAGDGEHLPGLEPPAPPPVPEDENIAAVWDHYAARFGDRLSKKELTEPRRKTIKKGLAAVNGDVALCKRAIDGLKSYRQSRSSGSTDISLSVIFSTGPHDRSNLTEKIEWWAAQSEGKAEVPTSVPSGHRGRVMDLATQALKVEHQPDNDAVRERGEQAQAILGERFGLKIISDGNGKLLRFEQVGE